MKGVPGDSKVSGPSLFNDEVVIRGDVQTKGTFTLTQIRSFSCSEISSVPCCLLCEIGPVLWVLNSRSCWLPSWLCLHPFCPRFSCSSHTPHYPMVVPKHPQCDEFFMIFPLLEAFPPLRYLRKSHSIL